MKREELKDRLYGVLKEAGVITKKSPCVEALVVVYADRESIYGHPLDDFRKGCAIWSVIHEKIVHFSQYALSQIGVKISREVHAAKFDNRVDICGYTETLQRCYEEEKRRSHPSIPPNSTPVVKVDSPEKK